MKLGTNTPVRLVTFPGEVHGNRNAAEQYGCALRLVRRMHHYLQTPGTDASPIELDHVAGLNATDNT